MSETFSPATTLEVAVPPGAPDREDPATLGVLERLRRRVLGLEQAPRIGGRYEPHSTIGSGGMGLVMSVTDHELGRKAALKVLRQPEDIEEGASRYESLRSEAQALARVNHPNVVPVFDIGRISHDDRLALPVGVPTRTGAPYLVMELVEGCSMEQWLQTPREWAELHHAFVEAGRGLVAAHQAGIVHRDFKPANVLVSTTGAVKVVDFGIAISQHRDRTTLTDGPTDGPTDEQDSARSGDVIGTPMYMAPEQLRGDRVDARADQFAWCVTLHRALFGRSPYPSEFTSMAWAKEQPVVLRDPLPPGVPSTVRSLLRRGLDPSPANRYRSMVALIEAFADLTNSRSRWSWPLGLAAVVLGAGLASAEAAECELAPSIAQPTHPYSGAELGTPGRADLEQTMDQAAQELETRVSSWEGARNEACAMDQAQRRGLASCLNTHRRRLETIASALAYGSSSSRSRAMGALSRADSVDRCLGREPSDDSTIDQRAREDLAEVEAMSDLGQLEKAWASVLSIVQRARKGADTELLAHALIVQARLINDGSCKDEQELLEEAYYLSARNEHAMMAHWSARKLTHVYAACLFDPTTARGWFEQARVWQERMPASPDRVERMRLMETTVLGAEGRYDEEEAIFEDVLARVRNGDSWGPDYDRFLVNYITSLGQDGRPVEAAQLGREVVGKLADRMGPAHPVVGEAMGVTGSAMWETGRRDDALAMLGRALTVLRDSYGDDHRIVLVYELNELMMRGGIDPPALLASRYERVIPRLRVRFGADHILVLVAEQNWLLDRVSAASEGGDLHGLLTSYHDIKRLVASNVLVRANRDERIAMMSFTEGHTLLSLGRFDEALEIGNRLIELTTGAEGPVARSLPRGQKLAALALTGLGRHEESVELMRTVIKPLAPPSDQWVDGALTIATILATAGEHPEAREWLDRASQREIRVSPLPLLAIEALILGLAQLDAGHAEQAANRFHQGLSTLPARDLASALNVTLQAALAVARRRTGEIAEADSMFEELYQRCLETQGERSHVCTELYAGCIPGRAADEG